VRYNGCVHAWVLKVGPTAGHFINNVFADRKPMYYNKIRVRKGECYK